MRRTQAVWLSAGIIAGTCRAVPVSALPDVTLWVVQPPGQLVAFDLMDFSRVGGVRIPPAAFNDPSKFAINGHGQFLVPLDDAHLWLWDGESAHTLPIEAPAVLPPRGPGVRSRQWLLGDDGNSLFVLQGSQVWTNELGPTGSDAGTTPVVLRETTLLQRPRGVVLTRTRSPCKLNPSEIAFEPEPCPDPSIWAPGGVVRGCVLFTQFRQESPGDTMTVPTASCLQTRYRRGTHGWMASPLEMASEEPPLDMTADGSYAVEALGDGGCCAELNASSEQTLLHGPDTTVVVFDEWSTFQNEGYEVSFHTADARITPSGGLVAYTVRSEPEPPGELPITDESHPPRAPAAAIRKFLQALPLVDVVETRPRPARILRLPHSELIGWASDSEVLVLDQGQIVAVDARTHRRRQSGISIRTAADAFVVPR